MVPRFLQNTHACSLLAPQNYKFFDLRILATLSWSKIKMRLHKIRRYAKVIVVSITFYSTSCLGQETAKGRFVLRARCHLSLTHSEDFTLSLFC